MASVREGRPEGRLWSGYSGIVHLRDLQRFCVIDQCAASVRDITYRVDGGGTRVAGTRPLTPERNVLDALRGFFQDLEASVSREGVRLPVLLWGINGKLYVRYGASRVYVSERLGLTTIPAVLCNFDREMPEGFEAAAELITPVEVLSVGFRGPRIVGSFECSHERLDAHRMEI